MATATLKFDLYEEFEEFTTAVQGRAWAAVVWELDQHLRSEIKYASDETPEAVTSALQAVRDRLREEMSSAGLRFPL